MEVLGSGGEERGLVGSDSRYDKYRRPASGEEYEEARALHAVAELLRVREHGLVHPTLTGVLGGVLDSTAVELSNGRVVARPVRLAVRRLAYELLARLRAAEEVEGRDAADPAAG